VGCVCGGGGAQEVKIDLMPPRVPKVSIIFLFWIFQAASSGRPQSLPSAVSFYLKLKNNSIMTFFARRLL
jgi:hypothetical protein